MHIFFGFEIPWFFLLFFLAIVASWIWGWWSKYRLTTWTPAAGVFETSCTEETNRRKGHPYRVRMPYSYEIEGQKYGGEYYRYFRDEDEARVFAYGVKDLPVQVRVNPRNPSKSGLIDKDVDTALENKAPVPEEVAVPAPLPELEPWKKVLFTPLAALAAAGFLISTAVNIAGWAGQKILPDSMFFAMHIGIFVVFVPAILLDGKAIGKSLSWKSRVPGVPRWMMVLAGVVFFYMFLNFGTFLIVAPKGGTHGSPPAIVWRGFSGHWMMFYYVSFLAMYSAIAARGANVCEYGHPLSPGEFFA